MRNLLGRLNARSAEDLTEIAEHWQTPLSGRDRLSRITQLYRAMTRPPMVRAQWDGLDSEEQRLVRVLIEAGDAGMTVDDVVEALGVNPDLTREMCLRLYEQGIVAYEGSARTLPIGESPRLFVPIELGNAVRRILREAQLGDISHYSLVELLALRSDQELFEAAAQWKIEFIPGVTTREQVTTLLNRAICNGAARRQQLAELGHEVRTVWERLTSVPQGTPVALDQILGSGNERTLFGRRNALDELEDRLLVWNMVTDDGSRALFIPRDLDSASIGAGQETPLPKAVSVVGLAVPYRPTAPIAWDLMVVLQRLFGPLAVPNVDPLAPGRTVLADLNQSFWNRGDDRPPVGYLEFLIELAVSLKLLEEPRDGASQFERTEEVREWRLRSWEEQSSRIRRIWMAAQYWIDGQNRGDIEPWNVDWRGFRIKLLNHLATLDWSNWYRVSDVVEWLVGYDPGMLGAGATVAINSAGSGEGGSEHSRALAALIGSTVEGVLNWLGLVTLNDHRSGNRLMRPNRTLHDVVRAEPTSSPEERPETTMSIANDLTVRVREPEPIQVWSLLAFAQPVSLGAETVFRITAERVRAATAAGFRPEQIATYLRRQKLESVPDDLDARILQLSENVLGMELTTALALDAGTEESARDARALLEANGYVVSPAGTRLYVTIGAVRPVKVDADRIHALLEAASLGPIANRSRY